MDRRELGRTGLRVSPVGFGAFKIGRNEKIKYAQPYPLPSEAEVARLLNGVLDAGCNYIDTAPAYGLSEERIGAAIGHRRSEFVLSTKVGERFENGESSYDFSAAAVRASIEQSLRRLRTDCLDMIFIHASADDLGVLQQTDVVETLIEAKRRGQTRAIGFSGKTLAAERLALAWADALMVEYHLNERTHEPVIAEAGRSGVGVVVKKGLASGSLPAGDALRFVLANRSVSSVVVGGLSLAHFVENLAAARP